MTAKWVLVASQARARIFSASNRVGPLDEVQDLVNPAGRMRAQELVSDGPGRHANGSGQSRHAVAGGQDVKDAEAQRFARDIADVLARARTAAEFEALHIVAEPGFMGLLRKSLDPQTAALVASETGSNIATLTPDEIRKHLPDFL